MTDRLSVSSRENIIWINSLGQTSMNTSEISINDESYVTAEEDNTVDETQYLSVLETTDQHDVPIEDLHDITLSNSKDGATQEHDELSNGNEESQEQQVVIFSIEGSDNLFGIQFVQDDEGNIKKYQFQFRTTEDGQLEAMPETIQLLPEENDADQEITNANLVIKGECETLDDKKSKIHENSDSNIIFEETVVEGCELDTENTKVNIVKNVLNSNGRIKEYRGDLSTDSQDNILSVIVKGEPSEVDQRHRNAGENIFEELVEYRNESEDNNDCLELCQQIVLSPSQVKEETYNQENQVLHQILEEEEETELVHNDEHLFDPHNSTLVSTDTANQDGGTILEYQNFSSNEIPVETQERSVENLETDSENYTDTEDRCDDVEHYDNEELIQNENESDNTETYETVEGVHVTADEELNEELCAYETQESVYQQIVAKSYSSEPLNVTNQRQKSLSKDLPKKNKTVLYYLMQNQEKENVNCVPPKNVGNTPMKTHPRSILRSDIDLRLISSEPVKLDLNKLSELYQEHQVPDIRRDKLEHQINDKRFARSKKAVEERLFNTFISKTTIPHAPVRKTRLPRKQKISPVDNRIDEEIIVQEVMVSSNGFVENAEEELKHRDKKYKLPTIELSDSEDEKPNKTKISKNFKRTTSLCSENSDISVIEILPSDEENKIETIKTPKKKSNTPKMGNEDVDDQKRTRDNSPESPSSSQGTETSPFKKSRTDSSDPDSDSNKRDIKCPHCSKTFPSQNSLSTHIQHHNLENHLRNDTLTTLSSKLKYKHKCSACEKTFKNSILLSRHDCDKKNSKLTCNICLKTYKDVGMLNIHKKSHAKQIMTVKTSTISISPGKLKLSTRKKSLAVSPKRNNSRPSTSTFNCPKKKTQFIKCQECQKVCSSLSDLSIHEKSHKKFNCNSCKATFSSKLLLDNHLRVSCVKVASPIGRRPLLKIRQSVLHSTRTSLATHAQKTSSRTPKKPNYTQTSTTISKHLDMQANCDSCSMKFRTLTELFKHKVKEHGLHTPDKNFVQEKKKKLYKPLPAHCGIPASEKLRKVWAALEAAVEKKNTS